MFTITRGFRSGLPILPGPGSRLTVCLSADPTSHTTALPVAHRRMGLARALSSGRPAPSLPEPPPRPSSCPSSQPGGLSTLEILLSQSHRPARLCAWGEPPPFPESQALGDGNQGPWELLLLWWKEEGGSPGGSARARRWHAQNPNPALRLTLLPTLSSFPGRGGGLSQHMPTWQSLNFRAHARECF